jgi:hypothetical protein
MVRFYAFDAWTFSFDVHLKHMVYDAAVTGLQNEFTLADNRLKLMDKVTFASSFFTDGAALQCFIIGLDLKFYEGVATVTVFAFRPPGQINIFIDPIWDAGSEDARDEGAYFFKDESYNLTPSPNLGTYADAGSADSRTEADYDFPDGTFADAQGEGTGQN